MPIPIPTLPGIVDASLAAAYLLTMVWAAKDAQKHITGDRTLTTPSLHLAFLGLWVVFLASDIAIVLLGTPTTVDYLAIVAVTVWLVADLLKFAHTDNDKLGIGHS